MKVLIVISCFIVLAFSADDFCSKDVLRACDPSTDKLLSATPNCNAKYGAIDAAQASLQHYANQFIYRSFNFLLMSTYYGNYVKNRPGFEKLYRGLSDSLWNDGIELIKYIDSRGGRMKFSNIAENLFNDTAAKKHKPNWELNELQSLAAALDVEKSLMKEAYEIHLEVDNEQPGKFDPEIAYHIEEEFLSKQKDIIRKLSGYTHDLGEMLRTQDASLAVYLFDQLLEEEKY